MEFWVFGILFLALLLLVSGMLIPMYRSHKKVTGGMINYDSTMRKFVYKVNLPGDEMIDLLQKKNGADELSCTFDFARSVIKFSEYGSSREYYFRVRECDSFSILRLEQVSLVGFQSQVPYKLNPFMIQKLQAELLPFSQYGF